MHCCTIHVILLTYLRQVDKFRLLSTEVMIHTVELIRNKPNVEILRKGKIGQVICGKIHVILLKTIQYILNRILQTTLTCYY